MNLWKTSPRRAPKSLSGSPAALPGGDLLPAGAVGGAAPSAVPAPPLTPDRAEVRNDPSSVGHHGGRALALATDTTTSDRAEGALRPSAATTGPGIVPERPNDEGAGHRPTVAAAAPPTAAPSPGPSSEGAPAVTTARARWSDGPAGVGAPVASYLDFVADLEDALAAAETARPPREFAPDTEERVDWLLRKLFEDQERAARIRAAAEARCAEIEGRMRYLASKYAVPLAEYLEGELPKARKGAKSIRLSEGIVGFRDEKGGPRVEDVREVERWAEAHDDPTAPRFGEWAYRVDKDRVLAHVLATGESVPGVEIREPRRLLYAQSDLRDARGKKAMKTVQITRLAAEALVAPPADEPEEE